MIRVTPASRLPRAPAWHYVVYALWGGGLVFVALASRSTGVRAELCPLRATTGMPCPLCGGTRTALSLATLDPALALATNPMVALALPLIALALTARFLTARTVSIDAPPESRRRIRTGLLAGAGLVLVLNWIYVASTLPATHA